MPDLAPSHPMTPREAGDGSLGDRVSLADWRRRVAALYAEVRAMATSDPAVAHAHWRAAREWLYREHPQSPVPLEQRPAFRSAHFDHDPRLRFTVPIEPTAAAAGSGLETRSLELPNSGADTLAFSRLGAVRVPVPDGERSRPGYWMEGYTGGLFIPFRDTTNGTDTYGAGRYLVDGAKGADLGGDPHTGEIIIDFNFAYQPSCAFDPRWACPLAPPENRLDVAIRAGERLD
jgi:uncharacterized protein (DUF1684 family)